MTLSVSSPGSDGFGLSVVKGVIVNHSFMSKFGSNPNADTTEKAVWDGGTVYTFPADAGVEHFISSSDNGDGQKIRVYGLDANFEEQSVDITLVGQTKTSLGASLVWSRIFRAYNLDGTVLAGDVYVYEDDTVVLGVPQTAAKISAKIQVGEEQTLMAIYTIPAGYTGYLCRLFFSADSVQNSILRLRIKEFERSFLVKHKANLLASGSWQHPFFFPKEIPAKSDVILTGILAAGSGETSGGFEILLVADE